MNICTPSISGTKSLGIEEESKDGLTEHGAIQRSPSSAALLRTTCRVEDTSWIHHRQRIISDSD